MVASKLVSFRLLGSCGELRLILSILRYRNTWRSSGTTVILILLLPPDERSPLTSLSTFFPSWSLVPPAGDPSQATTWSLRFSEPAPYLDFNHMFNRCLWEKTNQISWGKVKVRIWRSARD
jgi:hypothetical protein